MADWRRESWGNQTAQFRKLVTSEEEVTRRQPHTEAKGLEVPWRDTGAALLSKMEKSLQVMATATGEESTLPAPASFALFHFFF